MLIILQLRLLALRCLSRLAPLELPEAAAVRALAHVVEAGVDAESVHPVGVFNFRDAARHTTRLTWEQVARAAEEESEGTEKTTTTEVDAEVLALPSKFVCRLLLGRLHIQFT